MAVGAQWTLGDFGPQAEFYARARPGYPIAIVDRLVAQAGVVAGDAVTEVGAGTGLFTRELARRGFEVTALEPNPRMRAHAPALAGVTWTSGRFEATGLASGSQRWIVAASAFNWADAPRALPELRRLLERGRRLTILWNNRMCDRDPIVAWTLRTLRARFPEYTGFASGTLPRRLGARAFSALPHVAQAAVGRALLRLPGAASCGALLQSTGHFGQATYWEEKHRVAMSRARYVDLWRSSNHLSVVAGSEGARACLAEIESRLERTGVERIDVPYLCSAWSVVAL